MTGQTQAQLLAYVAQGLGFRQDTVALNPQILTMASLVQFDELEKGTTLPRFLLNEDVVLNGTANVPTLSIPSDFIREYTDEGAIKYVDPVSGLTTFLDKKPYDWLVEWAEGIDSDNPPTVSGPSINILPTGAPMWYSLRNKTVYVAPIPPVNYQLLLTYYAHDIDPSTLASGGQNKWMINAPGILANLVGVRMAEDLEYDKAVAKFQARWEASMKRLMNEEAAAEAANNEFVMGELV